MKKWNADGPCITDGESFFAVAESEEEAKRQAEQRAELERQQAELAAARAKAEAEAKAAREKLEAEAAELRRQQEAELAAQREAMAKERAAMEEERARVAEEVAAMERQREEAQKAAAILAPEPVDTRPVITVELEPADEAPPPVPEAPPTLRLGQMSERLKFTVTADFLLFLGFAHSGTDKAAKLFHEREFPAICAAISRHVLAVAQGN